MPLAPGCRKELEQRDEEAQTESPMVQAQGMAVSEDGGYRGVPQTLGSPWWLEDPRVDMHPSFKAYR